MQKSNTCFPLFPNFRIFPVCSLSGKVNLSITKISFIIISHHSFIDCLAIIAFLAATVSKPNRCLVSTFVGVDYRNPKSSLLQLKLVFISDYLTPESISIWKGTEQVIMAHFLGATFSPAAGRAWAMRLLKDVIKYLQSQTFLKRGLMSSIEICNILYRRLP